MPTVVQVWASPAPEKAGKLPERVRVTATVTGITIFAFATSSFYVAGLALALQARLAIYFSPGRVFKDHSFRGHSDTRVCSSDGRGFVLHPVASELLLARFLPGPVFVRHEAGTDSRPAKVTDCSARNSIPSKMKRALFCFEFLEIIV